MADSRVVETHDLRKNFESEGAPVRALRGVDFTMQAGEFVAVMGPSGSGKSTFMNLIGCLDTPTRGTYAFEGRDVSRLSSNDHAVIRNEKIGFVFQTFNLLPRLTALENVEVPLTYLGVGRRRRRARAREALGVVGLTDRESHLPTQLSGGQQQRVGIARALVNQPALILADEPTGNLDTQTSTEIMAVLQGLNDEGITILLVTHEPDIAGYARRCLVFRDGLIVDDGPVTSRRRATPAAVAS